MSGSRWAEYLDDYAAYVKSARHALDTRRDLPTHPAVTPPTGPVPDDCASRLVLLVAEATSILGAERARPSRPLELCHAAMQRAINRARRRELVHAT